MFLTPFDSPEFKVDAQHRVARCRIQTRSTQVHVAVAMPGANEDSCLTHAQLSEIFEDVEELLRATETIYPNDKLPRIANRIALNAASALSSAHKDNLSFSIVLSQGAYVTVSSTRHFSGCLWNPGRAVTLKIRQPQKHAPYSLSLRTRPHNAVVLAFPGSNKDELARILNTSVLFSEFESAPASCLKEIAKQLPVKQNQHNQLLLGYSGNHAYQPFASACVSTEPENSLDSNCFTNQLATISQELSELKKVVGKLPTEIPVDERPFDALLKRYQELEDQSVERSVIEPLNRELMLLYDLLPEQQSSEDSPALQAIRSNLLNILSIHGLEPYQVPGTSFDSQQQKCIGHERTDDQALDNQIASRARCGFRGNEKILRHEEVVLFRK